MVGGGEEATALSLAHVTFLEFQSIPVPLFCHHVLGTVYSREAHVISPVSIPVPG